MVSAVGVEVSQARDLVVSLVSSDLEVSFARSFAVINFPTASMELSQARSLVTLGIGGTTIEISQARTLGVVRGRIGNPKLRVWTFSLDGHDFYVLRLGDTETLVYDLYSEQWVDWANFQKEFWRANNGQNWEGASKLAYTYGSNVVVGDDTYGLLWFLDPEQPYDQDPDYLAPTQEQYFDRITMGQVPIRGREVMPCYACWITTDMGDPAYVGAGVTLYTSDDAGKTFDSHGLVTVTPGENSPELSWYSLGQIQAPGRLFKIVDDGAIVRIDGLQMNDPDDGG
jgi:hypothetical protein